MLFFRDGFSRRFKNSLREHKIDNLLDITCQHIRELLLRGHICDIFNLYELHCIAAQPFAVAVKYLEEDAKSFIRKSKETPRVFSYCPNEIALFKVLTDIVSEEETGSVADMLCMEDTLLEIYVKVLANWEIFILAYETRYMPTAGTKLGYNLDMLCSTLDNREICLERTQENIKGCADLLGLINEITCGFCSATQERRKARKMSSDHMTATECQLTQKQAVQMLMLCLLNRRYKCFNQLMSQQILSNSVRETRHDYLNIYFIHVLYEEKDEEKLAELLKLLITLRLFPVKRNINDMSRHNLRCAALAYMGKRLLKHPARNCLNHFPSKCQENVAVLKALHYTKPLTAREYDLLPSNVLSGLLVTGWCVHWILLPLKFGASVRGLQYVDILDVANVFYSDRMGVLRAVSIEVSVSKLAPYVKVLASLGHKLSTLSDCVTRMSRSNAAKCLPTEEIINHCINNPLNLQECCRITIREAIKVPFTRANLKKLGLPDLLISYVALDEELACIDAEHVNCRHVGGCPTPKLVLE